MGARLLSRERSVPDQVTASALSRALGAPPPSGPTQRIFQDDVPARGAGPPPGAADPGPSPTPVKTSKQGFPFDTILHYCTVESPRSKEPYSNIFIYNDVDIKS